MSKDENFSNRVSRLRGLMDLSQDAFAKLLGVSRNYVSMLENGREPSDQLLKLFNRIEAEHEAGEVPNETSSSGARGRLKLFREKRGLTKAQLARSVGYTLSVYQDIEDGRSQMSRKMAEKVARELGIDVDELIDGSDHPPQNGLHHGTFGETPDIKMPPGQRAKYVPLLSMAQCGTMMAYDDTAYAHDGFLAMNPTDSKAFAVTLAGDSMTPRFEPGDVAIVSPSMPPRNGAVVIARLNEENGGDVMLKLFQASGDTVTLSSYNPAYPPMTFPRTDFAWIYPIASVTKVLH